MPRFDRKQGIYGKTSSLYPVYHKKWDLEGLFFCIYPITRKRACFSGRKAFMRGTGDKFFCICPALLPDRVDAYFRNNVFHGTCKKKYLLCLPIVPAFHPTRNRTSVRIELRSVFEKCSSPRSKKRRKKTAAKYPAGSPPVFLQNIAEPLAHRKLCNRIFSNGIKKRQKTADYSATVYNGIYHL